MTSVTPIKPKKTEKIGKPAKQTGRTGQTGNRLAAFLFALCIILSLAACGGKTSGSKADGSKAGEGKSGGSADQLSGTVYVSEFIDLSLPGDRVYIDSGCCDGKNVYVSASISGENGDGSYEYRAAVYRIPTDGGAAAEMENYTPSYQFPDGGGWFNIRNIAAAPDGSIWVMEEAGIQTFDLPEGMDGNSDDRWDYENQEEVLLLRQLDPAGSELKRLDISGLMETLGAGYIQSMTLDGAGNIILCYNGQEVEGALAALDQDGHVLCALEGGNIWNPIRLSSGAAAYYCYDPAAPGGDAAMKVRAMDVENGQWGMEYPVSVYMNHLYDGAGDYLFYYDSGDSLYGYREETGGERLFGWSAADINVDSVSFFCFLEDGRAAALTRAYGPGGAKAELAVLTAADASALADKTVLSYAGMYVDQKVRADIIEFNRKNDKYRIEIRDYSEYNTADNYGAGLTRLNTEIIAGNIPDILSVDSLPVSRYAARGYLEDLWPLIDADPEISRSGLMERVFRAAETNGKLYQVFGSFSIRTAVGSFKRLGGRMGWTLDELRAALAEMPEGCAVFGETDTRDAMLSNFLTMNLNGYVDWEKGESHFDSANFRTALEFCKGFPEKFDYQNYNWEEAEDDVSRIAGGRQMLHELYISDFDDLQIYEAMFGGSEALKTVNIDYIYDGGGGYSYSISTGGFGGGAMEPARQRLIPGQYLAYVGYPREDGGAGSCFATGSGMAISSSCKDLEGAWSFVRQILLPSFDTDNADNTENEYYRFSSRGFPSNKADFDRAAEKAMEKKYLTNSDGTLALDEDGQPVEERRSSWGWGSLNIEIIATTREEYDQIMKLYNAIDSVFSYDRSIFDIVNEQAGAYFAGDRDIDETVKQIQDRVTLYINENR